MDYLNLTLPEHAYMFGFLQTDGHLSEASRNRGKLSLELSDRDEHILYSFKELIKCNATISKRTRNTNFKQNSTTATLRICDQHFRKEMERLGMPVGKKDEIMKPPTSKFSDIDYIRGLVDANGSLGITSQGKAFMSLTTKSDDIANYFNRFLASINGKLKDVSRNSRDNIYNITLFNEDAVKVVKILYYANCLSLNRKYAEAERIFSWERPQSCKKRECITKKWESWEDNFILNNSIEDSSLKLGRTVKSISTRKWRLVNSNK